MYFNISPRSKIALQCGAMLLSYLAILGCGPSSKIDKVIVRGHVAFDGEPISNGEIRFYPIEGTAGSVSGGPIKDGKYVAKGRGGVPIGKCRVKIRGYRPPPESSTGDVAPGLEEGRPAVQYLPEKYNAHSELVARIEDNGSDMTLDFDLTDH